MRDWSDITAAIDRHRTIIVATHTSPDGDGFGSMLGLGLFLKQMGNTVHAAWDGDGSVPSSYAFLPGQELIVDPADLPKDDVCCIAVDCASAERLGSIRETFELSADTINIDHHRDNTRYAAFNVVYGGAAACAELLYELIGLLCNTHGHGLRMTREIAVCLYTGIVTDTGRFQYSSTSPNTFEIAGQLLKHGVDPSLIFRNAYENVALARLHLVGMAYERTRVVEDVGFAYTVIEERDFARTGTKFEDSENLIDGLRAIKDIEVAAVFKETDEGYRVSLRSTGRIDVSRIADAYGGGGHPLAAGFTSALDLAKLEEELVEHIRRQEAG